MQLLTVTSIFCFVYRPSDKMFKWMKTNKHKHDKNNGITNSISNNNQNNKGGKSGKQNSHKQQQQKLQENKDVETENIKNSGLNNYNSSNETKNSIDSSQQQNSSNGFDDSTLHRTGSNRKITKNDLRRSTSSSNSPDQPTNAVAVQPQNREINSAVKATKTTLDSYVSRNNLNCDLDDSDTPLAADDNTSTRGRKSSEKGNEADDEDLEEEEENGYHEICSDVIDATESALFHRRHVIHADARGQLEGVVGPRGDCTRKSFDNG